MTHATEQQVVPSLGHLYPTVPAPVNPHVESGDTVVPFWGA